MDKWLAVLLLFFAIHSTVHADSAPNGALGRLRVVAGDRDGQGLSAPVWLNGREVGTTPLSLTVPPGPHLLQVFVDGETFERIVKVSGKKPVGVTARFPGSRQLRKKGLDVSLKRPTWVDAAEEGKAAGVWSEEDREKSSRMAYFRAMIGLASRIISGSYASTFTSESRDPRTGDVVAVKTDSESSLKTDVRATIGTWWADSSSGSVWARVEASSDWVREFKKRKERQPERPSGIAPAKTGATVAWSLVSGAGGELARMEARVRALAYALQQLAGATNGFDCSYAQSSVSISKPNAVNPTEYSMEARSEFRCTTKVDLSKSLSVRGTSVLLFTESMREVAGTPEEVRTAQDGLKIRYCRPGGKCCEVELEDAHLRGDSAANAKKALECLNDAADSVGISYTHRYQQMTVPAVEVCLVRLWK